MRDRPIKILLVEDNPGDARLLREMLAEAHSDEFELAHVVELGQATQYLADGEIDAILLDLSLPDSHGLGSFIKVQASAPQVPVIVMTGLDDEDLAVEAVRKGAQDYLVKGSVDSNLLVRAIRYAIERKRSEDKERLRNQELEALFNIAKILARPGTFEERYKDVLKELARIAQAQRVILRAPDNQEQGLRLVAAAGEDLETLPAIPLLPYGKSISCQAFEEGRIIVANDYPSHPRANPVFVEYGVKSEAVLHIGSGGQTLAVVVLTSQEVGHFNPERMRLLKAIGDGMGVLMENARLSEEIKLKEELERRQNTFISQASHELRTPMASIMGFSELLLRREVSEPTRRRWLDLINRGSKRLASIVDDLLSISCIQSGSLQFDPEPVELQEVVGPELTSVSLTTDIHEFRENISLDLPPVVADRHKLTQILTNLLGNAVKYSPEGGPITVSAIHQPERKRVIVAVEDHGIGIAAEDQDSLFTPFQRIRRPETRGIGGTGLGLSIVKALVEMSEGEVWLKSQPQKGSTFFFSLPTTQPMEYQTGPFAVEVGRHD